MIPNDFPTLNFGLGETADMLRDTVRSFTADEIAPRAEAIDRTNQFPRDLWPKFGDLGLLGITADEDWGGTRHLPGHRITPFESPGHGAAPPSSA